MNPDFAADARALKPEISLNRRGFVAASLLATGYAVAAGPVQAQAITTDTAGLIAGEGTIPVAGAAMPCYFAHPATGGPFPTILVIQEIFGVHEYIRDVCRRWAKLGFFAVAPELYVRQGDVSKITDIQQIMPVVAKVPDTQVMADLDETVKWAAATAKANTDKLGITGYCWGGRITWLYTAHNPKVKAAVAWYGRIVGQTNEMNPKHPLDVADQIKVPVLGLYGAADTGIPVDSVNQMKDKLRAAGNTASVFEIYADTPHAFHADYRPSYRKAAAEDGWAKATAWFKKYLA